MHLNSNHTNLKSGKYMKVLNVDVSAAETLFICRNPLKKIVSMWF